MAHKRLRPFNTRKTYPEQNLDNDLSQGVVAANIIFLRGQVAQDLETAENVAIGDPVGQTHRVMQNIRLLIEELRWRRFQPAIPAGPGRLRPDRCRRDGSPVYIRPWFDKRLPGVEYR